MGKRLAVKHLGAKRRLLGEPAAYLCRPKSPSPATCAGDVQIPIAMNTENRFRMIGVLTLAALLSYVVYGTTSTTDAVPTDGQEQSISDNS